MPPSDLEAGALGIERPFEVEQAACIRPVLGALRLTHLS